MKMQNPAWSRLLTLAFVATFACSSPAQDEDRVEAKRAPAAEAQPAEDAEPAVVEAPVNPREEGRGPKRDAMVVFGHDAELKAGQTAEAVVVIGGSAKIHGKAREAVVVIGGNIEVDGEVGDAVVAVLGNIKAAKGAEIHGDAVAVGGKIDVAPGATIEGHSQEVDFGGVGLPQVQWLRKWFVQCFLKMRPLSLQVGWVWAVEGVFFLLYLLIAAVFPRPVQLCVDEMSRRPATTFLMGLLTKLLLPLLILILAVTGVGVFVIPFVFAAVVLGVLVGKVAFLEWLGFKLGNQFGGGFQKPLAAFVLGAAIITLLYLVPILGLLVFAVISLWGLGGAATAAFAGLRKELPEKPTPPPQAQTPTPTPPLDPPPPLYPVPPVTTPVTNPEPAPAAAIVGPAVPLVVPAPIPTAPVLPDNLAYPKATFWERMGAGFLDFVLVCILGAIVGGPPLGFLVALAYFAGIWTWRGTSIGGIVLGLKVVRYDNQPITFSVALVRALAGAFSAVVFFVGFLWIIWDADKQAWHDKIAGTVVVRLPRGTPLVCL